MNVPMLALFGSKDMQVNPLINSNGFKKALSPLQFANATIKILPNLNHLFQQCTVCSLKEYGDLEETMAPVIFEEIIPFILRQ